MTSIAEVDYDTVFGGDDYSVSDAVCLFSSLPTPHPLNRTHPVFLVLLDVAVLFRVWVLPGRGSKQPGEHRAYLSYTRGATSLV